MYSWNEEPYSYRRDDVIYRFIRFGFAIVWFALICGALHAQDVTPTKDQIVQQLYRSPAPSTRSLFVHKVDGEVDGSVDASQLPGATNRAPGYVDLHIQFDFNSAQISDVSKKLLDNLTQALQSKELQFVSFAIEGHTDGAGDANYNQKLSLRRAEAVKAYLVRGGVAPLRLVAEGKGATIPLIGEDFFSPANRRVRVVSRQ